MTNERARANDKTWPDTFLSREYLRLKSEHPNCLLFLPMGAFLEAYGEDARTAAEVLGLPFNRRGAYLDGTPIQMIAIPADPRFSDPGSNCVAFVGSTTPYIENLVRDGHAVAIAKHHPGASAWFEVEWTIWPSEFGTTGSRQVMFVS